MAGFIRKAAAVWKGDLRSGSGAISTESTVLDGVPYSFATRFDNKPGTNPEELIAGAHAACFAMAFANTLTSRGHAPERIDVQADCVLERQPEGFAINRMKLRVQGVVPGIDGDIFSQIAQEADKRCPVSNLLRPGLTIELETELLS